MNRYTLLGSLLAVPALALFLASVPGCSKPADKGTADKGTAAKGDGATSSSKGDTGGKGEGDKKGGKGEVVAVKATDAVVKGKVVYDGTPPVMPKIKAMDKHEDHAKCEAGPTHEQTWLVSKDGGVENTVVFLEPAAGGSFALEESQVKSYKHDGAIDQPFCVYEPHIVALFAAYKTADGKLHETGSKLFVKNSSGNISHNTKITGDERAGNAPFNKNIDPGSKDGIPVAIKYQRKPIDVACDKHTWMNAKVLTFDSPFFAVTDKDGNFEIKNAPSGVEVTVKIWHEGINFKDEGKQTLKAGENDLKTIKIKAAS